MNVAERIRWFRVSDEGFALFERETVTQDKVMAESILYPQEMVDEYNRRIQNMELELANRNMERQRPRIVAKRNIANE